MSLFYYCISPTGILDFEITTISACGKRVQFESHNGITGDMSILNLGRIVEERDDNKCVVEIIPSFSLSNILLLFLEVYHYLNHQFSDIIIQKRA